MLLGNSYVLNQANVIHEEFHGNYSKFKILTGLGGGSIIYRLLTIV